MNDLNSLSLAKGANDMRTTILGGCMSLETNQQSVDEACRKHHADAWCFLCLCKLSGLLKTEQCFCQIIIVYTGLLKANKAHALILDVTPENMATDQKPLQVKLTLNVKK